MSEQETFLAPNGFIKPCPYREECSTYKVGCKGLCYWCGRFDKEKEQEE